MAKRVRTEREANIVVVASLYGWRGDTRLEPKTIRGYYKANENEQWDISNGGALQSELADKLFAEFKAKRPAKQWWSISETWSRRASR